MSSLVLMRPIEAYGDTVKELTFREPIGKDIRLCGFPIKFSASEGDGPNFSMPDAQVVHALIARLANIPPSAVDTLCLADLVACQSVVMGFFGDQTSGSTSSTVITISHGNGNGTSTDSSNSPSRS
jgi:Phage tail assembly chaperone proteins, E, or 41 or 14